jgi:dihydroorotase
MMSQSFDVILKSGTVVNQDGEGVRDIAVSNGRIAAIGVLGQASAAEVIDCKGLHILPDPQGGPRNRLAQRRDGRRHRRVRNAEHRSADHQRADFCR